MICLPLAHLQNRTNEVNIAGPFHPRLTHPRIEGHRAVSSHSESKKKEVAR